LGLISLGIFLVVRPRFAPAGTNIEFKLIGDIRRMGSWQVSDEEIWIGIGDLDLDMTQADIPAGETRLRIYGLIGDVDIRLPAGAEVAISSMAFVTDAKIRGEKREQFLTPLQWSSPGYEIAERRVLIETLFFINDLKMM
jgi:lia operon protein LiaF